MEGVTAVRSISEWLVNQIKFTSDEKKALEISKLLCKSRQLSKIMEFLSNRVHLKADLVVIRGNIRLFEEAHNRDDQDESVDHYDAKIVTRSLVKAKLQKGQLEHEIARLQKITAEMDLSQNVTKNKLLSATAQFNQLLDHHDKFTDALKEIRSKVAHIESLLKASSDHREQDIKEFCAKLKPKLSCILSKSEDQIANDHDARLVDHPDRIVLSLLEGTRSVMVRAQSELDAKSDAKYETKLNDILEEMWAKHLNSHIASLKAEKEWQLLEHESSRILEDSMSAVKDENLNRLILMRKTRKYGQSVVQCLNTQLGQLRTEDHEDLEVKKNVIDKYALVERQSKEMLGTKLMIEELLIQTTGQKDRVSHFIQAIHDHKSQLKAKFLSSSHLDNNLVQASLQHVYDHHQGCLSLDRIGKDSRCGKFLSIKFKPNFCHLMKVVLQTRIHRELVKTYSAEMDDMQKFGSGSAPYEVLEQLLVAYNKEKEDLKELIGKKLKKSDSNAADACCSNLLKSLHIFKTEPAREAFSKGVKNARHQGKSMEDWYNLMKAE